MHEKSDSQLVQEALNGSQEAFRLIVERTQAMVYRLAFRFLQNIHEAEDAVQDVYIKVFRNLHRYKGDAKLTTWMYTITANRCLDILKSGHKKISGEELTHESAAAPETPYSELENRELQEKIHNAVKQLTPKQQAVFVLRDLEGLSVKKTSDILSMKEGNVKSNLYHARKRIHELVSREYKINVSS